METIHFSIETINLQLAENNLADHLDRFIIKFGRQCSPPSASTQEEEDECEKTVIRSDRPTCLVKTGFPGWFGIPRLFDEPMGLCTLSYFEHQVIL